MLTDDEKLKKELEASRYPDLPLVEFVLRGDLMVLKTSTEVFEKLSKKDKLMYLDGMIKTINMLINNVRDEA